MKVNDIKLDERAILPTYATAESAGADLYMGVVSAILRFADVDMYIKPSAWTEPIAIIPYAAIIIYMAYSALKAKKA